MNYVFGVDFGGTRTKIGLVELSSGKVLKSTVIPTEKNTEQQLFSSLLNEVEQIRKDTGLSQKQISGIGISIGSYVFTNAGIVDSMCGFISIPDQYPLKDKVESILEIPCRVDNDARLIGYAESLYGAGKEYCRVLTLTLGTGVGVGFTVNKALQDSDACIHLAGHIKVRGKGELPCLDLYPCYCSVDGCLESTCSGTALERMAKNIFGEGVTNRQLFDLAAKGNEKAQQLVETFLDYLVTALNQYVYLFAPDLFVLGGGVASSLNAYLPYIQQRLTAKIHKLHHPQVAIAQLKEEGGIIGAASLFSAP